MKKLIYLVDEKYFKQREIYCQNCGNNIKDVGADVSSDGSVYCHGYNKDKNLMSCAEEHIYKSSQYTLIPIDFQSFREIQKNIKKGLIKDYKKPDNNKNLEDRL